jgi:hypothetical protein
MSIAVGYLRYPASHDDAGFQSTAVRLLTIAWGGDYIRLLKL